jgi:hypothetical protein
MCHPEISGSIVEIVDANVSLCSVPGINAIPHEDNLRYFDVTIHGPSQSPYEGTCFAEGIHTIHVRLTVLQGAYSSSSYFYPTTTQ